MYQLRGMSRRQVFRRRDACCQNSGTSIGLIGRRLRANYLLDSMEAIPTFEGGKRAAGRLPFIELQK